MKAEDLKNSILQLAMEGKLVPQDPNDEPASVLLEKIRVEKEKLIKEKKIKRNNKESFIFRKNGHFYEKVGNRGEPVCIDDEIPFIIPETWEYCRLNSIGNIVGGGTPKTRIKEYWEKGDIPWLTPADMKYVEGKYVSQGVRNITRLGLDKSSAQLIPKNSIIYSSRAPIGYIAISNNELSTNQGFKSFVPIDFNIVDYMYYCLISFTDEIKSRASGTTFKEISKTKFGETIIPIPPINEQKRIVEKIEEIIPLITEYGNLREKLCKLNSEFPDKLKSSILQEAIQGKLVPQDPNDEPASVLLDKIKEEKERLIKEKKIKRNKNDSIIYKNNNHFYEKIGKKGKPVCIDDQIPFDIPDNWEWTRIKNIVTKLTDGAHKTPKYVDKGIPFLSVKDMSSGYLDFSDTKYISHEDYERIYRRCNYEYGDILLTKVGTTGIPIIIDTNKDFGLFVSVALLKFNHDLIYNEFLVHLINSPLVQLQCIENTKGVGNKNWVLRDIGNTLITIPPLNEQIRIVEKLEEILQKLIDF